MNQTSRAQSKASFDLHRTQPHISADAYYRTRCIALGKSIAARKKIYLDTRYWLFLRDVELGRGREPIHAEIMEVLSELVAAEKAVCPLSDAIFMEVMKQTDPQTLTATARLIDRLSNGITLGNEELRASTEIARFLNFGQPNPDLHELDELVWTRTLSVMGVLYPRLPAVPPEEELVIQKAWIDHAWNSTFEEMLKSSRGGIAPFEDMEATAEILNRNNLAFTAEVRTYPQTVINEMAGVLDLMRGLMANVIEEMYKREYGVGSSPTPEQRADRERLGFNCIANAFQSKATLVGPMLRTLYVKSKCHAAVRWDRRRKLEGNDLYDFWHAAAAVGYCDAFFTEKDLRTLLTTNHVGLGKEFDCLIESREVPILTYLRGLQAIA